MFVRRSFWTFKIGAIISGTIFIVAAGFGIYTGIKEGMDTTGWLINIFMAVLGVALMAGGIYIHKVLGNANAGKKMKIYKLPMRLAIKGKHRLWNLWIY